MAYTPKYCCECGEKLENTERKFSSVRHFCELCNTQYGVHDKTPWLVALGGIFIGLFGFGSYLQKPEPQIDSAKIVSRSSQNTVKPETVSSKQVESNKPEKIEKPANKLSETTIQAQKQTTRNPETASNSTAELSYFCGAATKKGTPCSRRVKGGGRCWQHTGQAALLPAEKLVIANK